MSDEIYEAAADLAQHVRKVLSYVDCHCTRVGHPLRLDDNSTQELGDAIERVERLTGAMPARPA